MFRYGTVRILSLLLRILGWIMIVSAVALAATGIAQLGKPTSGELAGLLGVVGMIQIYGAISVLIGGLFMLVSGHVLQLLVDIALNTRPMAEMAESSKA